MAKIISTKARVKQICFLIAGVILCVYIFVPLFSAISARLLLLVSSRGNLSELLFLSSILDTIAFAASGFLQGLIISYGCINREVMTTLFGSLAAGGLLIISFCTSLFGPAADEVILGDLLLKVGFHIVFLVVLAIFAAWLVARKRHLKE